MRNRSIFLAVFSLIALLFCSCGRTSTYKEPDFLGEKTGELNLEYAKQYSLSYYDSGYAVLYLPMDEETVLIIPKGKEVPDKLPKDWTVIKKPLDRIYVVSTGAMDFFVKSEGLDNVLFSSLKKEDWTIPEVVEALDEGRMIYAGKYSAPDYETLRDKECNLVIENSMILHSPEVLNELRTLGFSAFIERASYEDSPIGRMEWIKLMGFLTDHEEKANEIFENQKAKALSVSSDSSEERPKVAIFAITSSGTVSVRKADDYMVKILDMAGADYVLTSVSEGTGSEVIQQEVFYNEAVDADYLIYNSSIEGEISSLEELKEKFPLIEKTKAFQDGKIACFRSNTYQSVMSTGDMIVDVGLLIDDADTMDYLYWL